MDYIKEAVKTESIDFPAIRERFNAGNQELLKTMVHALIYQIEQLDKIKKHLFYGKEVELPLLTNTDDIKDKYVDPDDSLIRIMHGIIGVVTESGEMLEILRDTLFEGKELDFVNLQEENGDAFWYQALLHNVMGKTFEQTQKQNIDKLQKKNNARYKSGKFNEEEAINRNTEEERKILEETYKE
jgi:NTP pyrophosphatase (non-canonical NTP hydrolase)